MSLKENENIDITPPEFLKDFKEDEFDYTLDSLGTTLDYITRSNSYFTRKRLIKDLKEKIMVEGTKEPEKKNYTSKEAYKKYLEEKEKAEQKRKYVFNIMKKPAFDDLVEYLIDKYADLITLEGVEEVTTREMYEIEQQMIMLAMEETTDHCLEKE